MIFDIQLLPSINDISADDWNRLAGTDYPFTRHEWLASLENSGCTSAEAGWQPHHLKISRDGQTVGLLPAYLKSHSYGEYVFDWSWADAYQRHGYDYYPKLVNAIPFTPATGPRLLSRAPDDRSQMWQSIHQYLQQLCHQSQLSGYHSLFLQQEDTRQWSDPSLLRVGCQFHWHNEGYRDFDDFLSRFNSRKRKSVRKERRAVEQAGVTLTRLSGDQITSGDWDNFYRFYHTTYLKKSGNTGYLNRDFFRLIAETMGDQILMINALKNEKTIAAALCFFGGQHLYGRYWGCLEEVPGLHFEACYYQGIEFAIERELQIFDPGAQGEHKIQRGFRPVLTYSGHWLEHPQFREAISDFLSREAQGVEAYRDDCASYLPFRQED